MIINIQISFIFHNKPIKVINYAIINLLAYELQITSYNRNTYITCIITCCLLLIHY